eukprot:gene24654-33125_t
MCPEQKLRTSDEKRSRTVFGFEKEVIIATISYYSRLAIWVTVLELSVIFFGYAKMASLKALKAVLAYCFLLAILIILKTKFPQNFNTFKWFCTPAILFLKSWASLFFFVYLVQLPLQLGSVAPEQIISWLFQIALGHWLDLVITLGAVTAALYLVEFFFPRQIGGGSNNNKESDAAASNRKGEGEWEVHADLGKLSIYDREAMYLDELTANTHDDFKTDDYSIGLSFNKFYHHGQFSMQPSIVDYYYAASIPSDAVAAGSTILRGPSTIAAAATSHPSEIEMQSNPLTESTLTQRSPAEEEGEGGEEDKAPPMVPAAPLPLPLIPTMEQLLKVWVGILMATALIAFLSPYKTQSAVVAFQLSAAVVAFILSSTYRMALVGSFHWAAQAVLQNAVLFCLMMIPLVLFSSNQWITDGNGGLAQFQASSGQFAAFGAGNYLSFLLDPAIVSLAFATVEPLLTYRRLLPFLVPVIFLSCVLILFQGALLAWLLQSPPVIAYPLITKCITTPIALSIASITGANTGVVAASSVMTGLLSLRIGATYLGHFKVTNPVARGLVTAVSGSFLGVVGLDERGETEASGVGMASFCIATVSFAILMGAVAPLRDLLQNIS